MGVIDSLGDTTEKATEKGQHYIETTKAYYKLKIFQQVSLVVGIIGKAIVIGSFVFIGFLFLAISGVIGLGELLGNTALACLIVGILFLLLGALAYRFRTKIDTEVIKQMAPKFFEST